MKSPARLLSLLLAVLLTCCALCLSACDNSTPPDVHDSTSVTEPAETTTTAPVAQQDLTLVSDGTALCTIVRNDELDKEANPVLCSSDIRELIKDVTKIKTAPKISTDWVKPGQSHDSEAVEILVGSTNYDESVEALSSIGYGGYVIKVVGNKLVITAYSDEGLNTAFARLKALFRQIAEEGKLVIPGDTFITDVSDNYLNTIPTYDGGSFYSIHDCGGNAKLIYYKSTSSDEYSAYLSKLASSGYTEYTTNEINGNLFATYTTGTSTLNVGFYNYEKAVRIVYEKTNDPIGLASDNVYTKVTTSKVTMLGLEFTKSSGEIKANGLSLLIRLEDGRFVVVDGGFNRKEHAELLINKIKEQSADYVKSGSLPTIAGWIITHTHGDHSGMIENQYSLISKSLKVEAFYVNFISDTERNKAMNSSYAENWGSVSAVNTWSKIVTAANALKAKVHYVHVGQVIYIADLRMDVLYTIESLLPKLCNAFNTTSLIFKMTFNSGDTLIMTGDATGPAFQICAKMYGSYLKADMLQVAHHGYTTWGTEQGTIDAYKLISPSILLWPQGNTAFPNYKTKAYNVVLFSPEYITGGLNKSFKELYVAGAEGEYVELDLPYTLGTAKTPS